MFPTIFGLYIFRNHPKISNLSFRTHLLYILHIWVINRQCIFGFPQYEHIPIHLDPFHLNFDFHFWPWGRPFGHLGDQSLGWIRRRTFEFGQTPDQLRPGICSQPTISIFFQNIFLGQGPGPGSKKSAGAGAPRPPGPWIQALFFGFGTGPLAHKDFDIV